VGAQCAMIVSRRKNRSRQKVANVQNVAAILANVVRATKRKTNNFSDDPPWADVGVPTEASGCPEYSKNPVQMRGIFANIKI